MKKMLTIGLISAFCGCSSSTSSPSTSTATTPSDSSQICEPSKEVTCNSLAGIWASGAATCASDGLSYDVGNCVRTGSSSVNAIETVYPAKRDDRWSNAKCNHDGDFSFTITMPPHPSNVWVVQLQGGGSCAFNFLGQGGCADREIALASNRTGPTTYFPDDRTVETSGLDSDPDFGNAIQVFAHYCSSDLWTGSNTTGYPIHWNVDGSDKNWVFTGNLNVQAMLDILKERYGFDDNNSNLAILFKGTSAGGGGVANNVNEMYERFPKTAASGNLMINTQAGYIPLKWDNPDYPTFGIIDPILGPLGENEVFGLMTDIWKSKLYQPCVDDHASDPLTCLSAGTLYDYITGGSASLGQMDLPFLIFQNRQDAVYMTNDLLPPLSSTISAADANARDEFVDIMNTSMGIDPTHPLIAPRIKWLYAVSDPQVRNPDNSLEPNVHGAGCYLYGSPDGAMKSFDTLSRTFWHSRGQGPGRGQNSGPEQVIIYDQNFATSINGNCGQ